VRVGHPEQDLFTLGHRLAVSHGETVETEPRHDGVQPGRELGLAAKVRQASVSAEERFLGRLFRFGRASEHAQGDPEHAVLMGGHEFLEGPRVTRSQPLEKIRSIGGISFPHI
jgi:hypothetical protein